MKKYLILILIIFSFISCYRTPKNLRKVKKEQARREKIKEKKYIEAKKTHLKKQDRRTRKRMKNSRKRAKQFNDNKPFKK